MIYLYLFGTCFHFIYVFMIIANKLMILLAYLSLSDKAYQKACHQEWTMDIPE